jgi:hypothetical protein
MTRLAKVVLCVLPAVLGGGWYAIAADATLPIVQFELAGSAAEAARIAGGRTAAFRDALAADYVFIAGYATSLSAACLLALRRVGSTPRRALRIVWAVGAVTAPMVAALDVLENLQLARGLTVLTDEPFRRAAMFATAKFLLLLPTLLLSVVGLLWIGRREPAPLPRQSGAATR